MGKTISVYLVDGPNIGETVVRDRNSGSQFRIVYSLPVTCEREFTFEIDLAVAGTMYKMIDIEGEYFGITLNSYDDLIAQCKSPQKYILNILKENFKVDRESSANT